MSRCCHFLPFGCLLVAMTLAPLACARGVAVTQSAVAAPPATADGELDRIRTAVEDALAAAPPRGYSAIPTGVRLRSIDRRNGAIVLDFNAALLAGGTGRTLEDSLHQIFTAASNARPAAPNRADAYTVLVDGAPLESYLR
jgi:hypothetical protein